jgi:hypothetical protein
MLVVNMLILLPLQSAAVVKTVHVLVEHGADVQAKNKQGTIALISFCLICCHHLDF